MENDVGQADAGAPSIISEVASTLRAPPETSLTPHALWLGVDQTMVTVARIQAERVVAKQRTYRGGLASFVLLCCVGMCCWLAADFFRPHMGVISARYSYSVGSWVIACGLVVGSTMPTDDFDINDFLDVYPWLRRAVVLISMVMMGYYLADAPHVVGIVAATAWVVWGILVEVRSHSCTWLQCWTVRGTNLPLLTDMVSMSTLFGLLCYLSLFEIVAAFCHEGHHNQTRYVVHDNQTHNNTRNQTHRQTQRRCSPYHAGGSAADPRQFKLWLTVSLLHLLSAVAVFVVWWRAKGRRTPTEQCFLSVYAFAAGEGITYCVSAVWRIAEFGFPDGAAVLLEGLGWLIPLMVVAVVGRDRLFGFALRRFERGRAEVDGAVMAELLDTKRINIGDTWWVHHDEAHQDKEALAIKFPNPWDHRRNWDEGRVVQVDRDQGRFGVVLQQRSNAPRVPFFGKLNSFLGGRIGSVARRGSVAPSLAPIGDKGDGGSKPSSRMSSRTGSRTSSRKNKSRVAPAREEKGSDGGDNDDNDADLIWIPLPPGHNAREDSCNLLATARANLKCIEGKLLTFDLMRNSKSTKDDPIVEARAMKKTEKINYFLSHSWHDDAERKWARLQALQHSYRATHGGRSPTFWLDKCCIDQNNISDGLKVLVINVMACEKLLVACGKTYTQRLWCVLEIFMLFAFGDKDTAMKRIEFMPILEEGVTTESLCESLCAFTLEEAHCYDPNEEARLRSVMRAVGEDRFVSRIRALGQRLRTRSGSRGMIDVSVPAISKSGAYNWSIGSVAGAFRKVGPG